MPETEADDAKSRREVITKLLPYMALSAIKAGISSTPLNVLTAAASRYNDQAEKTREMVKDILPLLPGVEKLQITLVSSDTVTFVAQRRDIELCAEQYIAKVFKLEGSDGAPAGHPQFKGDGSDFDYVLRLPSRPVYLKVIEEVTDREAALLRSSAQQVNPAEVWVIADRGQNLDVTMNPVFVSEGKVLKGRLKTISTADMLSELFDGKFEVTVESVAASSVRVTLRVSSVSKSA